MQYRMVGNTMPAVEVLLNAGESMYTQSGGMAWMTQGIDMTTNTKGGLMKGLGRALAGESIFMATYTSRVNGAIIGFASTVAGEIMAIDVGAHQGMTFQKGAFLCAQPSVDMTATITKKFGAGLVGGEGFILQKATGSGILFIEIDGDKVIKNLAPGEVLIVDSGNVVGFDATVTYEVETVKGGVKNMLFGGEGFFNSKFTGPGQVILQTQNFGEFASRVAAFVPHG